MTAQSRLLGGRYEIGGILGYGGMAEVHRGADMRLGRDVAVKMLRTDLARDEIFLTRFRREAQNAASLNHPSIVAVYDTGEDTGNGTPVPYIVMEYVEGRTLKEVLVAEGRLTPRRACEIVADTCAALDFSHRHQIIHRDIKPGNVMLSSNGQVKVMDFGIARAMAAGQATMTQTSAVIGTAQYLSPEQARGETVDNRSDVYATGCLLYELLCGDPPFTGDNPVSVAYQHVREAPKAPSQVNPDVPPPVDAIVLKALAKNPANRYQSAGEMREDLERAIAGRPVMATPVMSDDERTQMLGAAVEGDETRMVPAAVDDPATRSHTGRNVLITLLVLLLVGGLGFGAWYLIDGSKIDVPDVMGMEQAEAENTITKVGLTPVIKEDTSDESDKGKVTKQDPRGGTRLAEDAEVTLTIGLGVAEVSVPDLSDAKSKDDVIAQLDDVGLEVKWDDEPGTDDQGFLDQKPAPGEKVKKGSKVTVKWSQGNLIEMPDVTGMTRDEACGKLGESGFDCVDGEFVEGNGDPGTVASQDPASGQFEEGQQVTLNFVGVKVPNLVGKTFAEAQALVGDDFELGPADTDPEAKITKQDLKADSVAEPGATITVEADPPGPI
jgi:beta-lactam-binding protein with PASTA domain/predicted Ser/Thr protein kinase